MQFHMVRTSLDAHLAINTTGLSVHYYKGPMSQEEYAQVIYANNEKSSIDGILPLIEDVYRFCAALLQDKA